MKLSPAWCSWCWMVLLLMVAAAVTMRAKDDDEEEGGMYDGPERFHDVKGWRGEIVASGKPSQQALSLFNSVLDGKGIGRTLDYSIVTSVEFLLEEYEEQPSVWKGKVTGSSYETAYRWMVRPPEGGFIESIITATGPLKFDDDHRVELQFHRQRGWSVRLPSGKIAAELREKVVTKEGKVFPHAKTGIAFGMGSTENQPYPEKRMVLFASGQKQFSSFRSTSGFYTVSPEVEWDYTVYLEPTSLEELRLVIEEPAEYATWRPETTPDAGEGPPLGVKARVETMAGGQPKTHVEQFIWELKGTSKEPGVAMNWPLDAKDDQFDLELEETGGHHRLSADKQKLEKAIESGFSDAVKIVPRDWGGWSDLQVTAVLADGRRLRGKLKGKPEPGLLLPKRERDSHIADGWKKQHKSGADDLDDDQVEGQPDHGDGFTLYEEYRGWVVDGQHLEGDPDAKDFFVLNLIGGDAQAGLDLFAGVSQLAVHDKLRPEEMSETTRLMNGNHKQGAHAVDQHGVWIKTFATKAELGGGGAFTTLNKAGVAGRPGMVKGIGILSRTNEDSDFNEPFNLAASDMIFAYDRAIAHELLHSVGVEHHGEGDHNLALSYISEKHPGNKLGWPYYGLSASEPVDLRTEQGENVAVRDYADYQRARAQLDIVLLDRCLKEWNDLHARTGEFKDGYPTAQQYADYMIEQLGIAGTMFYYGNLGGEHGEHSGAEDCLMRYYFAKFYESKLAPAFGSKMYYLIEAGTEHIGMEICHDKTGTGVNAPGHKPQSRYGDAANGDCFRQICPNDAIPPRAAQ